MRDRSGSIPGPNDRTLASLYSEGGDVPVGFLSMPKGVGLPTTNVDKKIILL
jgi:hypothetical protein